jgi:hypothetical protein
LAKQTIKVSLTPEFDYLPSMEAVGLDPGHGEVAAGAVVRVGQGEGHGDTVGSREEIVHAHPAVGQTRGQHSPFGMPPAPESPAGAVDDHVFGYEIFKIGDISRLEDSKVAEDHIDIAPSRAFG